MKREASTRWLAGLAAKARLGLEKAVADDGRLALSVLERLEPALAPARQRLRLDVAAIPWQEIPDEALERIAAGEDPAHVLG